MKTIIKRVVACVLFGALLLTLVVKMNHVVLSKKYNRYYMLQEEVQQRNETYDVQVFGACHSYTSFQAKYFEEKYGYSAFDLGNPGEIVPVTYLRMLEQFKKDVPKVAMVEIWGLNAYETYSPPERVFEYYMPVNIEIIPLSLEKTEVINDFYSVDNVLENFHLAKYKDRVLNMQLMGYDFDYSFESLKEDTSAYSKTEMEMRFANNGFCEMPMHLDSSETSALYTPYRDISDYYEKQAVVEENETLELEADMVKYAKKIIDLCKKHNVALVFYRAPYVSTENELKKANWFADYCKENDVAFYDLEKEIEFDIKTDFLDYNHLNKNGALKATDFLAGKISAYLE